MMGARTPRMPAAPRVGRSGKGLQFGLQRLRRRVERAHNAVYAWICKPILVAGQAPASGSTSSRRWRARQHPRWQEVCPRMCSLSDTLADATRLLEAAPRLPPVTAELANRRFEPPKPDDVTSAETWVRLVVVNRRLRPAGLARLRSLDRHRASNGRDLGQSRARLAHRGYCGRGLTPCGMRLMHRPEIMKTRILGSRS